MAAGKGIPRGTRYIGEDLQQVGFRLPRSLVERLDAHVQRMRQRNPGQRITRADAARTLLEKALAIEENSHP
jgi:hypothetical protein